MFKVFAFKIDDINADILLDKVSLLSLEEQKRALRYKFKKDKVLSTCGRLMFACFAERYKSDDFKTVNFVTDTEEFSKDNCMDFKIIYDESGKGRVEGRDDLYFNFSHSKDYCVLALSDKEIGVDIQEIKPIKGDVASRFFERRDNEYIRKDEEGYTDRFIEIWSAKESYTKLTGKGIGEGLDTFYEDFENEYIMDSKSDKPKGKIYRIFIEDGYCCFVSVYL